jgi:hypothetical protein
MRISANRIELIQDGLNNRLYFKKKDEKENWRVLKTKFLRFYQEKNISKQMKFLIIIQLFFFFKLSFVL